MKRLLLVLGFLILFTAEILRVYLIMPFPGSQQSETIGPAYWLSKNITWIRILGLLLIAYPFIDVLRHSRTWKKIVVFIPLAVYGLVFYFFNFRFQADKMFIQPRIKSFAGPAQTKAAAERLVIGVYINGEARAYPVQLIGFHHQVRDSVGHTPVMVTYCTVCRTGRVYSPFINGRQESFRLVGMDHFNAMFEDATTGSWWRQATGEAIAGPLKGQKLSGIPSQQMTWAAWLAIHPYSTIMEPDSTFNKQYQQLEQYDEGTINSGLEKRDTASWAFKSWVIGIAYKNAASAYDWNELVRKRLIQDTINDLALLMVLEKDSASFHVFNRSLNGKTLSFEFVGNADSLTDRQTHSVWNLNGYCVSGELKGVQLQPVQAYQEFWHSWREFHPDTKRYLMK